ncbi:MAG: AbgT family transporter [Gammaproteobacteria bacterium]|nr:AbgT family transporter [Gammaproteobacteria bacterium]
MKQRTDAPIIAQHVNPIVIMIGILLLATGLTYIVDSGAFERDGRLVVPGSYQPLEKDASVLDLLAIPSEEQHEVAPVSLIGTALAIPVGLERMAGLIFMVLIIGGMFGIVTHTGAIDAGLEKLLSSVRGNVYILVPALMLVFAAGSSFLGLASEYLLIIPIMVAMATRLGLSRVIGLAIVTVPVKAGYLSSVTNPIPLSIAQPLVGLQIFSGAGVRFAFLLVFIAAGIAFVLYMIRREGVNAVASLDINHDDLSLRHKLVLSALVAGVAFLVYASNRWHWSHTELSAYYILLSIVAAAAGGIPPSEAAGAFVSGMKKILMATMLIGVASAVAVVLEQGRILDSIVHSLTALIGGDSAFVTSIGMFVSQLLLDFLIPSTSGQAAVSMPILGPLGQLTGVTPQTTVLTFLFGNGITNMLTPTSGTLLAYLATAQVGWVEWARFIFRLWVIYIFIAIALLGVAVSIGF